MRAGRTRSAAWRRSSRPAATRRPNEIALARVREDKQRESGDGFDGTWVAHPDLVPVATEAFDGVLGDASEPARAYARGRRAATRRRSSTSTSRAARSPTPGSHSNVSVGARYLDAWLHGTGAAAIDNLMEDVATAEIARAQVWSWVRAGRFDEADVRSELERVEAGDEAKRLFVEVALSEELPEFLTLSAYPRLPD